MKQFVNSSSFAFFYITSAVLISLSQFPALLILPFSPTLYRAYVRKTEELFGLLLVFITEFWSPATDIVVTHDDSDADLLLKTTDGKWKLNMPRRIVLIANHQIYADWIYLWCFAYFAQAHGALKIILKASLKNIPFFGWGMSFFDFIFLSRKWADDHKNLDAAMMRITKHNKDPMWLLLFPEGTVVSETTRAASKKFADKMSMVDPRHILLPRATGLGHCLKSLQSTVPYLYDFTIGYEGLEAMPEKAPNQLLDSAFPHEIYTLRGIFLQQKYPRHIHIHIRRWATVDLPVENDEEFSEWLYKRWEEKDALMDDFYRTGRFPSKREAASFPVKGASYMPLIMCWIGAWPAWTVVRAIVYAWFGW